MLERFSTAQSSLDSKNENKKSPLDPVSEQNGNSFNSSSFDSTLGPSTADTETSPLSSCSDFVSSLQETLPADTKPKPYEQSIFTRINTHSPSEENLLNQYPTESERAKQEAKTIDPFAAWTDGPCLRRESFTAEQLYYLTPRTMYLESRKVFIGDYPRKWAEKSGPNITKKLNNRVNYAEKFFPHTDFPHMSPRGPILQTHDKPYDKPNSSKTREKYWTMKGERRHKDIEMALEIGKLLDHTIQNQRRYRENLLAAERKRRRELRNQKLREVSERFDPNKLNSRQNSRPASRQPSPDPAKHVSLLFPEPKAEPDEPFDPVIELDSQSYLSKAKKLVPNVPNVPNVSKRIPKRIPIKVPLKTPNSFDSDIEGTSPEMSEDESSSAPNNAVTKRLHILHRKPKPMEEVQTRYMSGPVYASSIGSSTTSTEIEETGSESSEFDEFYDAQETVPLPESLHVESPNESSDSDNSSQLDQNVVKLNDIEPECISSDSSMDRSDFDNADLNLHKARRLNQEVDMQLEQIKTEQSLLSPKVDTKHKPFHKPPIIEPLPKEFESVRSSMSSSSSQLSLEDVTEPETLPKDVLNNTHIPKHIAPITSPKLPKRKRHLWNLHNITHKQRELVYQGRFLVEERETLNSVVPFRGNFAETPTRLVGIWREYAIFVKRTGNVRRPLVMYFYESTSDKKLLRRSQKRWTHSLEYRVHLGPNYNLGVFSGLDMSLALWKSKKLKKKTSELHNTRILVIQSPVTEDLIDLEYIISAATRGTPPLRAPVELKVDVPALKTEVLVCSYRWQHDTYNTWAANKVISYSSLKEPTASASEFLHEVNKNVWQALVKSPSFKFLKKATLAWLFDGHPHCPIWIPNSVSYLHPITRLARLMPETSALSLLQPTPRCYINREGPQTSSSPFLGGIEEPPALEGYCDKVIFSRGIKWGQYLRSCDHYLLIGKQSVSVPPFLSANQSTTEKTVEPYPLSDDMNDITWIKESTCLREIDYHDAMAFMEHERSVNGVAKAKSLINLLYMDAINVSTGSSNVVTIEHKNHVRCKLFFGSADIANAWCRRLRDISVYWKLRHNRSTLASCDPVGIACITPFLQNRMIVLSGPLYLKQHRMATFKLFHVLLTPNGLLAYRPSQKGQASAHPKTMVPVDSLVHRLHFQMSLHLTYVYDGPLAGHVLLENSYLDPNDPVSRSLPISYADGERVREPEIDRCLVVWRSQRVSKKHTYLALLARNTRERDQWATAIRYVQKLLAATNTVLTEESRRHALHLNVDDEYESDSE